jgi:DNA-binding response OmpR family regulator
MSGWSYLIDSLMLRTCKSNQLYGTSDLNFHPFFSPFSHRFSIVKVHPATVTAKEREILVREQTLLQNEQRLTLLLNQKDQEIMSLQQLVSQLQQQQQQFS